MRNKRENYDSIMKMRNVQIIYFKRCIPNNEGNVINFKTLQYLAVKIFFKFIKNLTFVVVTTVVDNIEVIASIDNNYVSV